MFARLISMEILKKNPVTAIVIVLASVLVGATIMVGVRFITYKPNTVHYHANFALYVNGVRDGFKGPGFYEEVQACTSNESDNPRSRVHMHNNVNNVVHVHARGVTWGQFFENLSYTLGDNTIETSDGVFVSAQDGSELQFVLNGEPVDTAANRPIKSEDVLLVNYGNDDTSTIKSRYDVIPPDAHKYNERHDPASCAGSKPLTFLERLKVALGFNSNS